MASSKSKSKSRDRSSAKAAKEQQKASSKPSGSSNTGNSVPANAYNPISGTFHALETPSVASSLPSHENSRFRNIDDTDDHSTSPHGTMSEYDSVSNNGSCSGESEDPKDKTANCTPRQDIIPGSDNDRREKIRLKNERKHQRQRERRAQELHERCSGYLMSRKLELLSQQLVAMGFSSERATLALILNEGRVEESVSWLVSNEEESHNKDTNLGNGGNLKIDISQELGRILAIEARYKCSKQEVERAVVACEGDLEKAEETLKVQKQEAAATQLQPELTDTKNSRPQDKPMGPVTIQQRRNDRDFNYTKAAAAAAAATVPSYTEPGNRNPQSLKINQSRPVQDKRFVATGSGGPSVSLTMTPTMQGTPSSAKLESRHSVVGNEGKNIQLGALREPVIMMQRPQSINAKHNPVSSASPPGAGWYPNNLPGVEGARSNGKVLLSQNTGSLAGLENQSSGQFYRQSPYKEIPLMYNPVDSQSAGGYGGGSWSAMGSSPPSLLPVSSEPRSSWNTLGASSPSLTVPSSLGLFSGWSSAGTFGSSTQVDWNTGPSMPEFDYTSIDWTLDSNGTSNKSSGLWLGVSSMLRNGSGMRMGGGNGVCIAGLQDGLAGETSTGGGSREWTSPFAGKDIFSLPRQFVTSPSP